MAKSASSDARVKDYLDYSRWLLLGWLAGLLVGRLLDQYFTFGSPALEGLSRFIVGYGDTIGASVGILIGRVRSKRRSHAETFWVGTILGTLVGPLLHFVLVRIGFTSAGLAGALIAIAYSNADNWGGVISSYLKAAKGAPARAALRKLYEDKFVVANVVALLLMFSAAILIRVLGSAPSSYFAAAVEGALLDNDSTLAVVLFVLWRKLTSQSPPEH